MSHSTRFRLIFITCMAMGFHTFGLSQEDSRDFRKIKGEWKIAVDHTSLRSEA